MNAKSAMNNRRLISGFLRSSERHGSRIALEVDGRQLSYAELRHMAERIAATLLRHNVGDSSLTAIFAYRSVEAFAGVLAALLRGHGYVPLNRTFPPERTRLMLERSGCHAIVLDQASAAQLSLVLVGINRPILLLLPGLDDISNIAARFPQHRVLGAHDLVVSVPGELPVAPASADAMAYLLFTSGSTGVPKGVMVSQRNVLSYLDFVVPRYKLTEEDRCSQTFDMTFDLSAHDMFVTWEAGACLCCPTQKELIKPGGFISRSRLTTWFSVPSTLTFMKKLGMLKPGTYPDLRLSLFCGEALPLEIVRGWADAAPNSIIENIYGPTELTIACTAYRWNHELSPAQCKHGIVPIGEPFSGMEAVITDENLVDVQPGEAGELLMTGPQLSLGYWRDEEKTAKAFVKPPGSDRVFYRTGDRVQKTANGRSLLYLGRVDNQVKVLGHRVELGEVEAVVREESKVEGVIAVGWPVSPAGAGGIEVFLQAETLDTESLQKRLALRLPVYMTPRRIHLLPVFPLNSNGKFDRMALTNLLKCQGDHKSLLERRVD